MSKQLEDESSINRHYGKMSKSIIVRLSVLMAADNLSKVPDIPPTKRHKLSNGNWSIAISKNWRIIFRPLNGVDPNDIDSIEIVDIEDYH